MSYDLMVFRRNAAPQSKKEFMDWYEYQTQWTENIDYDDPSNTSEELKDWFMEMKEKFPAMNGPYASDDIDDLMVTDYSIGKDVIYAAFAWSQAGVAYQKMTELAAKYKVGFFDASGTGEILFPDENGILKPLYKLSDGQKPWWKIW